MMRALVLIGAAAALAACAPVKTAGPDHPLRQCDAEAARSLIGTHVGAVSFPADTSTRVVCTTCPTTKDYRADRLNVRFNQETGIIEQVDCG